jgi:RND family efflux transporter MFP subunit
MSILPRTPEKTKALLPDTTSSFWKGLAMALAVVVLIGGWLVYRSLSRVPAEVFTVVRSTATASVYGTVKIQAAVTREVRSQNTGYVKFAEGILSGVSSVGFAVAKDQVLATISDEATTRSLQQAQTELAASRDRQKLGPPSTQLLRTAKDNLDRLLTLQPNSVPAADLEKARGELKRLTAAVEAERVDLQRSEDVPKSNVAGLEEQLRKTEIRSPMQGIITTVNPADGDLVYNNAVLFLVATRDTYVEGQVNEEDVGEIKDGMHADVRLYSYSQREFTARVSTVLPSTDPNSQRYTVVLYLDQPPENLRAGMTGEMNIIIARRENALVIPSRALMTDQAFIVEDGVIKMRTLKIGYRGLETVEIVNGLNEGDQVVVSDQDTFRPGQRVRPVTVNSVKKAGQK